MAYVTPVDWKDLPDLTTPLSAVNIKAMETALAAYTDSKIIIDGAAGVGSLRTLGTGGNQAAAGNDARLSDSRTPTGAAGGALAGSYPNPTLAAGQAIPSSLIDAKGDLVVGIADNTASRLAIGTDGTILVADSSQPGGIRWSALPFFDVTKAPYSANNAGTADAATAINSAITAANAIGGGIVKVPVGTYRCDSTIVGQTNVFIWGDGAHASVIKKNFAGDLVTFNGASSASHCRFAGLRDINLYGNSNTGRALNHVYADQIEHHNVYINGNVGPAVDMAELWDSRFYNVFAEDCGSDTEPAFWIRSSQAASGFGSSTDTTNIIRFIGCQAESWANGAFRFEGGPSGNAPNKIFVMGETKIESYKLKGVGIYVAGAVNGLYISDFTLHMGGFGTSYSTAVPAIRLDNGSDVVIERGFISNGGTATITDGVRVFTGGHVSMKSVAGSYQTAPTNGNHINLAGGGPYYVDASNKCGSNARPINAASGVRNMASSYANRVASSAVSITNTTETVLRSLKLPSNTLQSGAHYEFSARGTFSASAAGTLLARLRVGANDAITDTEVCATGATGSITSAVGFEIRGDFTIRSNGSGGTCIGNLTLIVGSTITSTAVTATTNIDTTVDEFLGLYLTAGGTSPNVTVTNIALKQVQL